MAGTTINKHDDVMPDGTTYNLRLQFNKLIDDLETLRASHATLATKLNADAGVTDANYASVLASALLACKVADQNGVTT